jgi:hypothetical protein
VFAREKSGPALGPLERTEIKYYRPGPEGLLGELDDPGFEGVVPGFELLPGFCPGVVFGDPGVVFGVVFGLPGEFGEVPLGEVVLGVVPLVPPGFVLPGFVPFGVVVFGLPDPGVLGFCGDCGVAVPAGGVAVPAGGVAVPAGGVAAPG